MNNTQAERVIFQYCKIEFNEEQKGIDFNGCEVKELSFQEWCGDDINFKGKWVIW